MELTADQSQRLVRLNRFASLLDEAFVVPGTNFRFGLYAVVGLIPGFGDFAMVFCSIFIIWESVRFGAPRAVIYRMMTNVGIEAAVGVIPIFGDVFDAVWKANVKNIRLLERYAEHPQKTKMASTAFALVSMSGFLFFILGLICLSVLIVVLMVLAAKRLLQGN